MTSVCVEFRIMDDCFDVQQITNGLDIVPTETWSMGDAIRDTGKHRSYTSWNYSTGFQGSLDVSIQLAEIERLFSQKVDTLCTLKSKYDLNFSIDVVIYIENGETPALFFEGSILRFATRLDARFDCDIYII